MPGERFQLASLAPLLADFLALVVVHARQKTFEVAEALKLILPEVPLFLVAEHHDLETEKEALSHGIDAVFEKDHDFSSLVKNARAVCGLE